MTMLVSIIVPAYNAGKTIAQCVQACLNQTHASCEVIIVDDGSTDDTASLAQAYPVRFLRQPNKGPAAARNLGAVHASGDVLAFTDSDCVPHPDWIERLLEGFTDGVAGVGGTYSIANHEKVLARMLHEEIAVRHEGFGRDVEFLGSFNVAFLKSAFDAVGGFDESFARASAEDNDLSYRLRDAGGLLRFEPRAVVAHYHPTRLWPYLRTQARHGYWRMKLYRKHLHRAQTGDQYASAFDLMMPPLALLAVAAPAPVLAGLSPLWALAVLLAYAFGRGGLVLHMWRRTRQASMLLFFPVAFLRDAARAMGMVAGVARFMAF